MLRLIRLVGATQVWRYEFYMQGQYFWFQATLSLLMYDFPLYLTYVSNHENTNTTL